MSADRVINVLVTITLIQLMVTIGLGVTFAEMAPRRRELGPGYPNCTGQLCRRSGDHCRSVASVPRASAGLCQTSRGRRMSRSPIWAAVHGHGKRPCADFDRFDGSARGIFDDRRATAPAYPSASYVGREIAGNRCQRDGGHAAPDPVDPSQHRHSRASMPPGSGRQAAVASKAASRDLERSGVGPDHCG